MVLRWTARDSITKFMDYTMKTFRWIFATPFLVVGIIFQFAARVLIDDDEEFVNVLHKLIKLYHDVTTHRTL